ncbi:MAG TPA: di-heme oxidoredictase family protein, partial [Phycisphaerae bacterium]|nr:di-heme oxidoredictase family protein [Phycisphaerae bacterium]
LHDGRAETLKDAILAHGGEAQAARDNFASYDEIAQDEVVAFLKSLGGLDQYSDGLVEPNTPIPAVGDFGGPLRDLTTEEADRFIRGREAFDRDHGHDQGIGGLASTVDNAPRFNGDSCRACHFDPVIGGSGPRDVNVMRHCIIKSDGNFEAPPDTPNTIIHRQIRVGSLPAEPYPGVNFFEMRQTPHVFGFGLIDAIADDTIMALADPDDANSDGISGRPNILADGRIGRLGWKADVPSLAEFVRDAMGAEMGITMPVQTGLTFGITEDGDGVADPEIELPEVEDMTFFMSMLAGPPRKEITDPAEQAQVDAGEALFGQIGCTKCHVPALPSSMGNVPLFSDLLLHEILPADHAGIVSADAQMREFRTAPLWGLRATAPYFHSGEADTIEEAILLHDGEAAGVRAAYSSLSAEDKAAVLAFLNTL